MCIENSDKHAVITLEIIGTRLPEIRYKRSFSAMVYAPDAVEKRHISNMLRVAGIMFQAELGCARSVPAFEDMCVTSVAFTGMSASDGVEVSTRENEAALLQKFQMEWKLICDELTMVAHGAKLENSEDAIISDATIGD